MPLGSDERKRRRHLADDPFPGEAHDPSAKVVWLARGFAMKRSSCIIRPVAASCSAIESR
jgi:hypothetical protein